MSEAVSKTENTSGSRRNEKLEEIERIRAKKEDDIRRKEEAIRITKMRLRERRKLNVGTKLFLVTLISSFSFFITLLAMSYIPGIDIYAFAVIEGMVGW